ncbi:MAG: type I restriction enzyme HsdR N-terminal domain-containing protein [Spirosomataceae bacterium]
MEIPYPILSLPACSLTIQKTGDQLWVQDIIRKKWILLTPEEWVRQHMIHLLISHFGYTKNLIRLESGHTYHQLKKRSDIVAYNREGSPFLLVECKSTEINLNQQVLDQASRYNWEVKAPFICLTNGLKTLCFSVDFLTNQIRPLTEFPRLI